MIWLKGSIASSQDFFGRLGWRCCWNDGSDVSVEPKMSRSILVVLGTCMESAVCKLPVVPGHDTEGVITVMPAARNKIQDKISHYAGNLMGLR